MSVWVGRYAIVDGEVVEDGPGLIDRERVRDDEIGPPGRALRAFGRPLRRVLQRGRRGDCNAVRTRIAVADRRPAALDAAGAQQPRRVEPALAARAPGVGRRHLRGRARWRGHDRAGRPSARLRREAGGLAPPRHRRAARRLAPGRQRARSSHCSRRCSSHTSRSWCSRATSRHTSIATRSSR